MKKLGIYTLLIAYFCLPAEAQIMKKLGSAVKNAAENATVRKAEQKTEEAVNKTIDKVIDPGTYKGEEEAAVVQDTPSNEPVVASGGETSVATPKSIEAAYAKSDFVPGDEIFFADELSREKPGEFPSQWDLLSGRAEIAAFQGSNSISFETNTVIAPLMKDMNSYLPEVFTIEFDVMVAERGVQWGAYYFKFFPEKGYANDIQLSLYGSHGLNWYYYPPGGGDRREGGMSVDNVVKQHSWNHIAISFNQRAFKLYINGTRVINIPSMVVPKRFELELHTTSDNAQKNPFAIKDFRMAKGAMPLYDRLESAGKIVTYGITFDVGKSTLKPESMTEINRIAQLMKDNPALKFSVEGHTDSTGNSASNQTLSDSRSKAVMDKLVEIGISADRLQSAGKGQNNPISDNSTDEGRAKNRRVEFVKI